MKKVEDNQDKKAPELVEMYVTFPKSADSKEGYTILKAANKEIIKQKVKEVYQTDYYELHDEIDPSKYPKGVLHAIEFKDVDLRPLLNEVVEIFKKAGFPNPAITILFTDQNFVARGNWVANMEREKTLKLINNVKQIMNDEA